jgi:hypothetical protein
LFPTRGAIAPPEVVVSIASVRLRNPMPFSCRPVMVSMRCVRDLPNRSRRQTTSVSSSLQ